MVRRSAGPWKAAQGNPQLANHSPCQLASQAQCLLTGSHIAIALLAHEPFTSSLSRLLRLLLLDLLSFMASGAKRSTQQKFGPSTFAVASSSPSSPLCTSSLPLLLFLIVVVVCLLYKVT